MKYISNITIFVFIILCMNTCTENPFFEDEIDIQKNHIIKGKVNLGFGIKPNDVYIWIEGLNLYDWTDDNGNFIIELPPVESQPGNGLNGIYSMYVYLANYKYEKFDILVLNGEFKYDTDTIDKDGTLKKTIVLTKILDIKTFIMPDNIETTTVDTLNFNVQLECLVDSVFVQTHFNKWNTPSSLIFSKNGSTIEEAILIIGAPATFKTILIKDIVLWPTTFVFPSTFFREGTYKINPYIRIVQNGLPDDLLLSINNHIFEFDFHYLYWPIKTQAGLLTVSYLNK